MTRKEFNKIKNNIKLYYKVYRIPQKKRKKRIIEEPFPILKKLQKQLVNEFRKFPFRPSCIARKGKNTLDNYNPHKNAKYILKLDISECFRNITKEMVIKACEDTEINTSLLDLCFLENKLPTGAPSSPVLCNIALTPLDKVIEHYLEGKGYTYTRYIDDLHISTEKEERDWKIINDIKAIIRSYGLKPNTRKTMWQTIKSDNVIITGIRVGTENKVPRELRRKLRSILQNLAKDKKPIDETTAGLLAYVRALDVVQFEHFVKYYHQRLDYEPTI